MPRRSIRRHTSRDVTRATPAVAAALAGVAVALLPTFSAGSAGASTSTSTTAAGHSGSNNSTSTSSPTAKPAKPTAGAEYAAALKAARGQGVHFHSTATENGTTIDVIGDTGATSGAQTITVKRGSVVEHVQVVRVGPTGYVKANNPALHNVIGLTSAQSSKYSGHWLYFPASNTALDALIGGLLEKDVSSELQMRGPYSYATGTTSGGQGTVGHGAVGIRGSVASESGKRVQQILYVPASGPTLPRGEVTNPGLPKGSSAIHGTVTFSNWGEKKTVTRPAHSVSLLKIANVSSSGSSTSTTG
jgi:hypothetical protein